MAESGSRLKIIPIVFLIILSEAVAQISLKYFHETDNPLYFMSGVFGYAMVCVFLVVTYRRTGMGIANSMWSALSIITMISVGIVLFNEKIPPQDIIGVVFIFIGVCILFFSDIKEKDLKIIF